ncbi:ABC transporter substrate-binding protein [Desulfosediminicola ganghwensis]|uniref:ABC transporter substrate-binding protein n=1 Tax=Desulfosediminicola ganghwensis TaxID=2569540 RepID=UPI001E5ADB10|nr:ABC transporter substrate-binding protein [Desulfosediminicola ganghwensis]
MNIKRMSKLGVLICLLSFALYGQSAFAQMTEITDDEGSTIRFDKPFSRIISLYPAHTENLAFLGCDEEFIGIGRSDNYPASISDKNRFSYRDNTEKFLAARPDLILIRPMISRSVPELISKLRSAGITVVSLQPTNIDQMFDYWRLLGLLTGKTTEADKMVQQFTLALDQLEDSIPVPREERPRVYFEAIHSKMKTFAPDAISMFALETGGGLNIANDAVARNNSNIAPYGKERILAKANEIDIYLSQTGRMNRVSLTDIYNEPGFQLIKALQTNSVFLVDEELVSRPTMRLLTGISKIQSALYPVLRREQPDVASHEPLFTPQTQLQKWQ